MNSKLFAALALSAALIATPAVAAEVIAPNAFGLVYENAISENVPGKVNIRPVSYEVHGVKIAANVYVPAGFDETKKYPAVVVAHPNGGVKEQVSGMYAQKLAELGYVALAADAAYQGASGGEPRGTDIPYFRTEDVHGMADFISTYPGVDANRIGALGICGGGGYTLNAAKTEKRFKGVATLSMFNTGRVRRLGYMDSQTDSVQQRLKAASDARAEEARTGKVVLPPVAKPLTKEQIAKIPVDLYREGMIYYGITHKHPNGGLPVPTANMTELMAWDATDQLQLLDAPLLIMAGSKADSLYMSKDAFEKAVGTKDKELFLIDGATHIQTYYVPEYVDAITNKLKEFFGRTL